MSKVTNIIIATSISEDITYLENKFKEFSVNGQQYRLVSADSDHLPRAWYGGSKLLEANIFIGAYNYLDLEALIFFMKGHIQWQLPQSVQLIVKEHDDTKFRIIDLI